MCAIAWSTDGALLASGDFGNKMEVRRAESGEVMRELVQGGYVQAIARSPDDALLASSTCTARPCAFEAHCSL